MGAGREKIASNYLLRLGVGLLLATQVLMASAHASEASLRVAFVYNFLKFIEWPNQTNPAFTLCAVNSEGDTRQALAQLESKSLQSRAINITYIDLPTELPLLLNSCQLLYVPASGADFQLPQPFPAGVLLVMDEADPGDERVGISLLRTFDNRIEFVMNEPAIQHAGVKVSSQLRKLAKTPQKRDQSKKLDAYND